MRPRVNYDDGEAIGVYAFITPSGKVYVGMTCDSFERRWLGHRKKMRQGKHRCPGLQRSFDKYGWNALERVILEQWEKPGTLEALLVLEKEILRRERYWWEQFYSDGATMLHGCPTGTGSVLHSEETRAKMSAASRERMELPAEELNHIQEIVNSCTSRAEAEELTGYSIGMLKRRNLTLPRFAEQLHTKMPLWNVTREELEQLYYDEEMTTTEIAAFYGCCQQNMYRRMKRMGIVFRRRGTRSD